MFPVRADAEDDDWTAAYDLHHRSLTSLARELKLPQHTATRLIHEILLGFLRQESADVDAERWLAESLRVAAASCPEERSE